MLRLLAPGTIILWILDLLYVLIDLLSLDAHVPGPVQGLAFTATTVATVAWIAHHRGFEYHHGYQQGRADAERDRP